MALVDLIRKRGARTASAISATSATSGLRQDALPVAGVATVAVADERKGSAEDITPMARNETQALLAWLEEIGETDPAGIDKVLRDCERDLGMRVFFFNLVEEAAVCRRLGWPATGSIGRGSLS